MKTYPQLTEEQKERAVNKLTNSLLDAILQGLELFDETTERKIVAAMEKAEHLQTPWFAAELVMEAVGDKIKAVALEDAEQALYSEPEELVVTGIL